MAGDWRARSRCTIETTHLFDELSKADQLRPDGGAARIAAAQVICAGCPVRIDCLEDALTFGGSGVRGGEYVENGRLMAIVADRADGRESIVRPAGVR